MSVGSVSFMGNRSAFSMLRSCTLPNRFFGEVQIVEKADKSGGKMRFAGINCKEILADNLLWSPLRSFPIPATQARSLGA